MEPISIAAPDERTARDLANGGLLIYGPCVSGTTCSGWQVQLHASGRDLETILSMVRSWLRRNGLSEASLVIYGKALIVPARGMLSPIRGRYGDALPDVGAAPADNADAPDRTAPLEP
jgi:hypothetical protein